MILSHGIHVHYQWKGGKIMYIRTRVVYTKGAFGLEVTKGDTFKETLLAKIHPIDWIQYFPPPKKIPSVIFPSEQTTGHCTPISRCSLIMTIRLAINTLSLDLSPHIK